MNRALLSLTWVRSGFPFCLVWVSLMLTSFLGNACMASSPQLPSLRWLGWITFPYSNLIKWQEKRILLFMGPQWNCCKIEIRWPGFLLGEWWPHGFIGKIHFHVAYCLLPMNISAPESLAGVFARLWHFHLEDEWILSWATSPFSLGRTC